MTKKSEKQKQYEKRLRSEEAGMTYTPAPKKDAKPKSKKR